MYKALLLWKTGAFQVIAVDKAAPYLAVFRDASPKRYTFSEPSPDEISSGPETAEFHRVGQCQYQNMVVYEEIP